MGISDGATAENEQRVREHGTYRLNDTLMSSCPQRKAGEHRTFQFLLASTPAFGQESAPFKADHSPLDSRGKTMHAKRFWNLYHARYRSGATYIQRPLYCKEGRDTSRSFVS